MWQSDWIHWTSMKKKEILKHGSGNVIKITSSLDDVRCRCLELGYENGLELPKFLVFIVIFVVFIEWIRQQKKTYLTFYRHPFLVRHSTIHRKSYSLFFRFLMYEIFELIEFNGSNARSISYRKKKSKHKCWYGRNEVNTKVVFTVLVAATCDILKMFLFN